MYGKYINICHYMPNFKLTPETAPMSVNMPYMECLGNEVLWQVFIQ